MDEQQAEAKRNAASAVKSVMDTQRTVTRSIGKINSALAHLEKGREVNIKTDTARVRLQEILSLLGNIRGAATMTLHLDTAAPATSVSVGSVVRPPYAPVAAAVLSDKEQAGLNKRLYADEAKNRQRMQQAKEKAALQVETFRQMSEIRAAERAARLRESERARADRELRKIAERTRREELNAEKRRRQAEETQRRRNAARAVTSIRRQAAFEDSVYGSKRRAAINRIQYSKAPSWRNLPMAGMLNAYMAYTFLRTQFTEAVEYSNIMQSAHSILRLPIPTSRPSRGVSTGWPVRAPHRRRDQVHGHRGGGCGEIPQYGRYGYRDHQRIDPPDYEPCAHRGQRHLADRRPRHQHPDGLQHQEHQHGLGGRHTCLYRLAFQREHHRDGRVLQDGGRLPASVGRRFHGGIRRHRRTRQHGYQGNDGRYGFASYGHPLR